MMRQCRRGSGQDGDHDSQRHFHRESSNEAGLKTRLYVLVLSGGPRDPASTFARFYVRPSTNVEADLQVRLKVIFHAELHDARCAGLRRDAAERPGVEIQIRRARISPVEV